MNDQKPSRRPGKERNLAAAFLGVGISVATEIAVACAIGFYLGNWIDEQLNTAPYAMAITLTLFLTGSMVHAAIVLNHLNKRMQSDD
jgi:F0F1-type ATP synthase assembly protein I